MVGFIDNYVRRVKELLLDYSYIRDIGVSYNSNVLLKRNVTGSLWVGKISKSLVEKGVDFRDLNARAVLAYRLAKGVKHKIVKPKVLPAERISGIDIDAFPQRIDDCIFVTPFRGRTLSEFLQHGQVRDIKNSGVILDNVVFNIWIGNYDRKDSDYIVDDENNVVFIDYHLYGPGFRNDHQVSLGAYAESYSIDDPNDTGWCVGSPMLLRFVRETQASFDAFLPMIQRIEKVRDTTILRSMKDLEFYDERNEESIRELFLDYISERRYRVRAAIQEWIAKGYPKGHRPKDSGREDNIYTNIV